MNKRGEAFETGTPAATLIGIIALIFVFYILFLPAEQRAELLDSKNVSASGEKSNALLLSSQPGRLSFAEKKTIDHSIPNIYLAETRNAVVLGSENPFVIEKSLFGEQRKTVVFTVSDLKNTAGVFLGFQSPEHSGTLVLALNGQQIFEGEVSVNNPPPVSLPVSLLKEANIIEFSVKGGFFSSKKYSFRDMKIVGDITAVEMQVASNTFSVSNIEHDNIDTALLEFFPLCRQKTAGVIDIKLNEKIVYSAVPVCDSLNRQELFKEDLLPGRNSLVFSIKKGSYSIEQARVRIATKPGKSFVDFFDVKSSLYNAVLDKKNKVTIYVEFVDDSRLKRAQLNINGRLDIIDQKTKIYARDISALVREGNNYLELKPLTDFDIARLEVRVE